LSPDHTHWVSASERFFLPHEVLRKVFRGKFVYALRAAFRDGQLRFEGDLTLLAQPNIFAAWLRPPYRQDWIVYLKPPFDGPQFVLQHLGRYIHRVAISNHRLASFANGKVTFRWRDSAHNNEQKLLTLSLDEFLRRFLLHVLPKGVVRIRHFGFWPTANVLPTCHFASSYSARHRHRARPHPPMTQVLFGYAPYVVGRCGSSKGLSLRKSNFVLRPPGTASPHDITTTITNRLALAADAAPLCPLVHKISFSLFQRSSSHSTFDLPSSLALSPCRTGCTCTS
jgi:hypothetical protein